MGIEAGITTVEEIESIIRDNSNVFSGCKNLEASTESFEGLDCDQAVISFENENINDFTIYFDSSLQLDEVTLALGDPDRVWATTLAAYGPERSNQVTLCLDTYQIGVHIVSSGYQYEASRKNIVSGISFLTDEPYTDHCINNEFLTDWKGFKNYEIME